MPGEFPAVVATPPARARRRSKPQGECGTGRGPGFTRFESRLRDVLQPRAPRSPGVVPRPAHAQRGRRRSRSDGLRCGAGVGLRVAGGLRPDLASSLAWGAGRLKLGPASASPRYLGNHRWVGGHEMTSRVLVAVTALGVALGAGVALPSIVRGAEDTQGCERVAASAHPGGFLKVPARSSWRPQSAAPTIGWSWWPTGPAIIGVTGSRTWSRDPSPVNGYELRTRRVPHRASARPIGRRSSAFRQRSPRRRRTPSRRGLPPRTVPVSRRPMRHCAASWAPWGYRRIG